MIPILQVKNLRKLYGKTVAVDDVSFSIQAGHCFGLLGPNGAGKTTTLEMIEGLLEPSAGEIFYGGKPRDQRFREQIGIQFQATAIMDFLTVREVLHLFSQLYPQHGDIEQLIHQCELLSFADRFANKLSGGQLQRVLLALALLNKPKLIFLDEPTTGLDPQSRRNSWQLIESVKAAGTTVVLTTHYMDEAQALCDQLAIVDAGRIIAEGSPQQLLQQHFGYVWLSLDESACINQLPHLPQHRVEDGRVIIQTLNIEHTLAQLGTLGVPLGSLAVRSPSLEDLFLKFTGSHLREAV